MSVKTPNRIGAYAVFIAVVAAPLATAQHAGHWASAKPARPAQAVAYKCVHCGIPIRLKSKTELEKTCAVCKCGLTNLQCKPAVKA